MRFMKTLLLSVGLVSMLAACGGGGGSSTSPTTGDTTTFVEGADAPVSVTVAADYGTTSGSIDDGRSIVPTVLTICLSTSNETTGSVAGMDCDSDGGVVAYEDPTGFSVAIKRLALVKSDNTKVDLIADTGTLSASEVLDLASPVTLDVSTIPQGTYSGFYVEFYYYDLTMELYDTTDSKVRIYLSDDDFASEGNVGNHQGDVKLDDGSGTFGFVPAGGLWTAGLLDFVRPADIGGSASDDPETGHDRGLYGNDDLWNATAYMQGSGQDIFIQNSTFGSNITVDGDGGTFTMTFDLSDTWFYEDFNNNGKFEPCVATQPNEACAAGSEWSPVFPGISFSFTE